MSISKPCSSDKLMFGWQPSSMLIELLVKHCACTLQTRKDRLESVTELNAWGQDVEDISILSQSPHIRTVALACNCIKTLR